MKNLNKDLIAFIDVVVQIPNTFAEYPSFIRCANIPCDSCFLDESTCISAREHLSYEVQDYIETKYPEVLL